MKIADTPFLCPDFVFLYIAHNGCVWVRACMRMYVRVFCVRTCVGAYALRCVRVHIMRNKGNFRFKAFSQVVVGVYPFSTLKGSLRA